MNIHCVHPILPSCDVLPQAFSFVHIVQKQGYMALQDLTIICVLQLEKVQQEESLQEELGKLELSN